MKHRHIRCVRFLSVLLMAMFAHAGFGQETGASLLGVVHDGGGATVSRAIVSATNVATNGRTVQRSNENGEYSLLNLAPGTYSLHIEATGFRGYDQNGIRLELNQHATQNVTLEVGQVAETVTVNSDVSGLDTVASVVSDEVNGKQLRDLPLNTRNPYGLLELIPGFSGSTGDDYNSNSFSISGGRQGYHDTLVDGTPAGFPTVNGNSGIGIFPSIDAIGEFHVLAQNYPAEFGRSLDGVVNVVFKSGTNQFHGTLFEFIRNSALDSNSFFSNRNGTPLPLFHRNQFGGVLSGPIYKNKTFFLVSTELLRANQFTEVTNTVPTALQRNGDFSQTFGANGQLVTIYNPFSTRCAVQGQNPCTSYTRDPFPGNVIPKSMMSAVGVKALSYYPMPTSNGNALTHANNYFANGGSPTQTTAWDVRVDHAISDKQKVFGRYSNRFYQANPQNLWPSANAVAEGLIDGEDFDRGLTAGYTAFPTPTMIFDARLGFSRTLYNYLNKSLGFQGSTLGLPADIDSATGTPVFPVFAPAGYTGLGNNGNRHNAFMTYSLVSSLTWVHGPHTFKAGFDGRLIRVNDHESADSSGNFTFGTNWTQLPNAASANTGNGIASLLLGTGTGDVIQEYKDDASQSYYFAEYFQDDWRVNHKLTLNLGLRYDLDTPRTDRFNRMNYFNPTIASPLASKFPGLEGGLVFVGVNGQSRHQYHIDANNLAPRFGFSYAADKNTVVHGGAAIVYGPSAQAAAGTVGPYGFRVQSNWISSANNNGITPSNLLDNPFPQGFQPPPGAANGLVTGVGSQIEGALQNTPTPYVIQYNLDIQQSLPYETTFDIAYVGDRGRKQQQSREGGIDFDQLPVADLSLGSQLESSVANPFYGSITNGALTGPQTTKAQLLIHYPQFTSVLPLFLAGGNNQYDALQLRANKRFASGLQLQASYVWAKNFDNGTNHQNSFDPMADYAVTSYDVRQRFIVSYIYDLPFGRGRMFANHMSRAEDIILGGWQVNGITTLQGGNPLQISASNNLSNFNFQTLRANTNGQNASLHGDIHQRLNKYFNTADFSQPAPFALGSGPAYYDGLRGPGLNSTDLSLFKEFSTFERLKVQFRAEAYNTVNHVQFGNPDTGVTDASFGQITSQANSPRQVQFGLKLLF
jgi:Carboxypeptidase regulatory-like domain